MFFFCKQKTAYEMRISDWSSDVCSSDLAMTDLNGELIRLIEQNHREDGSVATAIPRLHLVRFSRPTERIHGFYEPAFCIVAQGRKRAILGDRIVESDGCHFLVVLCAERRVGKQGVRKGRI